MNNVSCRCGRRPEAFFQHLEPLCRDCFFGVVHRRCRKAFKDFGGLKPRQKVCLAGGRALEALFKTTVKGLPLEYVPLEQAEVVIVGRTADDVAEDFLKQLFSGRLEPDKNNVLNLFENLSQAELERYCELGSIKCENNEKSVLRKHLEALEQRYPGTFFALQKAKESFE